MGGHGVLDLGAQSHSSVHRRTSPRPVEFVKRFQPSLCASAMTIARDRRSRTFWAFIVDLGTRRLQKRCLVNEDFAARFNDIDAGAALTVDNVNRNLARNAAHS